MKRLVTTVGAVALALSALSPGAWAQTTTAPTKADPKPAATVTTPAKPAVPAAPAAPAAAVEKKGSDKVDLNTASAADLKAAGFTDAEVKKIVDGRPWKRKDELVKKNVVSEDGYKKVKDGIVAHQMKAEKKK
jgi:competence protein ComEA